MNYYYDLTLNFDMDHLWEFYEWEESDVLSEIKKIPLFRVDFETIKDFSMNTIKVDESFAGDIAHKTIFGNATEDVYAAFLISDSKNSLAVMLNEEGNIIALSKPLIVDDNNINEYMYTMRKTEIPYQILGKRDKRCGFRQEQRMKHFIQIELQTLLKEKNVQKLQYLYYEWFQKEENDLEKMYEDMMLELSNPINDSIEKISHIIELSYHQV